MEGKLLQKNVNLDCSVNRFIRNGIPEEDAIILLKHLHYCIGDSKLNFLLKTENVFGNHKTNGFEAGNIVCNINPSTFEPAQRVEHGGICLAFLFFSNTMSIISWTPILRRGEGIDYICKDSENNIIVVEVGGRTSKNGAKSDLSRKIARFKSLDKRSEPTYISSVGFMEGEHIVHRYNW